jgi:hypothetical protein
MRFVSPLVRIEHVDLVERIARVAFALEHEPLAVRRPVTLAGAFAFNGQTPHAAEETSFWRTCRGRLGVEHDERTGGEGERRAGDTRFIQNLVPAGRKRLF